MKEYGRIGIIGRFKPVHNGHASMLEAACERAEHLIIGIGSSNRYNARNPFTAEESREMIDLVLKPRFSNYEIIFVPDFGHYPQYADGKMWEKYVKDNFGMLNFIISGNGYVSELLRDYYDIINPEEIIPQGRRTVVKATQVRMEIATGGDYRSLLPEIVTDYLEKNKLIERMVREFGAEIIEYASRYDPGNPKDAVSEKQHITAA
ncbi:MAG: adenylyltransferase/cytidyltransferase family protein [Nanoarchaeota archaeon]|nr:adenylyltransferase/cytidyltransferase family protein [Nanoarchaeota archaeon]